MNMLNEMLNATETPVDDTPEVRLLSHTLLPDMKATRIDYGAAKHGYSSVASNRSAAIAGKAGSWADLVRDVERVRNADGKPHDVTGVDLSKARLRANGRLYLQTDVGEFPLREHAFGQLCSAIGAPASYLATLPVKTAIKAVAWGLRSNPIEGDRTLRFAGDEVRAIVTDRYVPFDDMALLGVAEVALDRAGIKDDVQIEQLYMGKRTGARLSIGKPVADGNPSTGLGARSGVGLGNGELGNGSKKGSLSLYVPWCTNGCSINIRGRVGFRVSHLSGSTEELIDSLLAMFEMAPRFAGLTLEAARHTFNVRTLQERIDNLKLSVAQRRAVLRETLAEALGLYPTVDSIDASKLKEARAVELELHKARTNDEKRDAANAVYDALGLGEADIDALVARGEHGPFNEWQLVQGITAVARDTRADDEAERLEELGGSILAAYL